MNITEYPRRTDLHFDGKDQSGKRIIIDASELSPNHYEIMAIRPDGEELDVATASDYDNAKWHYEGMMEHFLGTKDGKPLPPLTGKYAKLRDDLIVALAAGRAAEAKAPEDGGTCNLDAASLHLPHWKGAMVERAAKEAGTWCSEWSLFGQKRYVFHPATSAQGNARMYNAQAMTQKLKELGYDAFDYSQMD